MLHCVLKRKYASLCKNFKPNANKTTKTTNSVIYKYVYLCAGGLDSGDFYIS